ncbi:MAG: hypothetical protein J2P25_24480, partial [Nocardiopsaceae bacterium]|nr:hypothetical protein [Nocardiopsaceae bacterium]
MHPVNAGLLALGRPRFVPSAPASAFHLVDRYLIESGRDPAATYQRSNVAHRSLGRRGDQARALAGRVGRCPHG